MSETSPLLRQESDAHRSLHDRIVDVFRPPGSSRVAEGTGFDDNGGQGRRELGITTSSDPDARARLLESYNQLNPVCGERRCSHGTFSPRPGDAERQTYLGTSNGRFGYGGVGDAGTSSSHFSGGGPESHPESEYTSQMKSSLSALSMNEHNKLYARLHVHLRRQIFVTCHESKVTDSLPQIHLLLHSFLQLDWPIPLGFFARGLHSSIDHRFRIHSNGLVVGFQSCSCTSSQWPLFFCDTPFHIRDPRKLSSSSGWTRGGWVTAHRCYCENQR